MRSWRLLTFLLQHARGTLGLLIGAGLVAGLFSAALLALITRALADPDLSPPWLFAGGFLALAAGRIGANLLAQLLLVRFSQGMILELSLTLARRLLDAPLRLLERRGSGPMLATLTDDVSAVTWAVQCIPQLTTNLAVVVGCSIYLVWLSVPLFAAMLLATGLGAWIYAWQHRRAFRIIHRAREERSTLFEHFRSLTQGLKELMLHRRRRDAFLSDDVRAAADAYRRSNLAATTRYALADAWVQVVYHGLIALVLFAAPLVLSPSREVLTGYVFAMLYLMAPLWSIIGTVPTVARGQAALGAIEQLGVALEQAAQVAPVPASAAAAAQRPPRITMQGVVFHYDDAAERGFRLGPLDLAIEPGELLFVVGGNGSGKSTFVKLLCGLYTPQSGVLAVDGRRVEPASGTDYRELFSVVFSDFHLFRALHGIDPARVHEHAPGFLRELQLDGKVTIDGMRYSTIDLSQGQRKRLALVSAYLEDRSIVVFDEWAADQDPEYKHVFYDKLLPELRARGKTVVVITHDDRFFHLGDRLLKLEDGRITSLAPPRGAAVTA
jgi:putative pyoverdin transport system ATP-binding/permease protein